MTANNPSHQIKQRECAYCGETKPTTRVSTRGGDIWVCRDDLSRLPSENRKPWPTEVLSFCPKCGRELEEKSEMTEDWVRCPTHGRIHVEYYKS